MSLLKNSRFRFVSVISITFLILIFYFNGDHNHDHGVEIVKGSKSKSSTCHKSMIESDQFICESDEKWQSRRDFYSKQHEKNTLSMNEYEKYFYLNWLPEFQCHNETRIGYGDGGKWVRFSDLCKISMNFSYNGGVCTDKQKNGTCSGLMKALVAEQT
ncbi:unnamed protein product, partial [Rotaria magnacalcarata]